jgi:hypothetical protein
VVLMTTQESRSDPVAMLALMRRGMLWLAAGGAVVAGTWCLKTASTPYLLGVAFLVAGLYAVVLGVERILSGYRRGRLVEDPREKARVRAAAAAGLTLAVVVAATCAGAWSYRSPYWRAVKEVNAGHAAAGRLKAIAQRHAARMEARATGLEALERWKESAAGALPLRPDLAAALEGAKYLSAHGSGPVKDRAGSDARFFGLCLEWMDLYARVESELRGQSMEQPPEDWTDLQNDIVRRIQAPDAPSRHT